MSSPESFTPEGTENFVAPDESKRIDDPATAESMARDSHNTRSDAAESRKEASHWRAQAKEVESAGTKQLLEETAGMWEEDAKNSDIIAESIERTHERQEADQNGPVPEVRN